MEKIKFIHAGLFTAPDLEWIHPARTIDTAELILMQKGTAYLEEEKVPYLLKPGDCLLLEPHRFHRGTRRSEEPVSFYWIHFSGPFSENFLQKHFALTDSYRADLLCRQLLHYANTPDYPPEASDYLLRVLILELSAQSKNPSTGNRRMHEICEWIRINVGKPLSSAETAAHFGYNEDYLCRLFKQKYGMGLKQYISETKLCRIKTLLLSPDYSLQEIASMTGFSEYKYFLKFFRYHEGSTPTEFRSLYFNTHMNNH